MRAMTYLLLGVVGTIALQRYTEQRPRVQKELRRMINNNSKSFQRLKALL